MILTTLDDLKTYLVKQGAPETASVADLGVWLEKYRSAERGNYYSLPTGKSPPEGAVVFTGKRGGRYYHFIGRREKTRYEEPKLKQTPSSKIPVITESEIFSIKDKMTANSLKFSKMLTPEAESRWIQFAKTKRITPEELKRKTAMKLQDLVDEANVWVRLSSSKISKIIKSGRFKSVIESHIMGLGKAAGLKKYLNVRLSDENDLFQISDTDVTKRPIYGYLSEKENGDLYIWEKGTKREHDSLAEYGDVRIKMKSEIRDRSTFTLHDSLDVNIGDLPKSIRIVPSMMNDIRGESALGDLFDPDKKYKGITDATQSYSEVQMHGGVSIKDIDTVYFEKIPDAQILDLLKVNNIKYVLMSEKK